MEVKRLTTGLDKSRTYVVTYPKPNILQIAVLAYFLTSKFTNTTFQFPHYVHMQYLTIYKSGYDNECMFSILFYVLHLTFETLL